MKPLKYQAACPLCRWWGEWFGERTAADAEAKRHNDSRHSGELKTTVSTDSPTTVN
jgi:hypothetical protein